MGEPAAPVKPLLDSSETDLGDSSTGKTLGKQKTQ